MSTTKETSGEDEKFFFNFSFQLRAIKKKKKKIHPYFPFEMIINNCGVWAMFP